MPENGQAGGGGWCLFTLCRSLNHSVSNRIIIRCCQIIIQMRRIFRKRYFAVIKIFPSPRPFENKIFYPATEFSPCQNHLYMHNRPGYGTMAILSPAGWRYFPASWASVYSNTTTAISGWRSGWKILNPAKPSCSLAWPELAFAFRQQTGAPVYSSWMIRHG